MHELQPIAWIPDDEFAAGHFDPPTAMERRDFLRLMSASLLMAGLSGCNRPPPEHIVPLTHQQTAFTPGVPQWYATSVTRQGYAMGVRVRSDDGRPTKIEGNPLHPASLGATDAITQAELLSLYDPGRSASVRRQGMLSDWTSLETAIRDRVIALEAAGGRGLHVVLPPTTSPTLASLAQRVMERAPQSRWYRHDSLSNAGGASRPTPTGRPPVSQHYDLSRVDVIVTLDCDLFGPHPQGVRLAHDFAEARRRSLKANALLPHLFVAEPVPTLTGARADDRVAAMRSEMVHVAQTLAAGLDSSTQALPLARPLQEWVYRVVMALRDARGRALVVAGPAQPAELHRLVLWINQRLDSIGSSLILTEPIEPLIDQLQPFSECVAAMEADEVDTLFLLGVNPVYDALERTRLSRALPRVPFTLHLGLYRDETAELCAWHAPMTHELEQWSDARAFDGTAGLMQPLTRPLYAGRSLLWILSVLAGDQLIDDHQTVMNYWRRRAGSRDFDRWWRQALATGVIPDTAAATTTTPASAVESAAELLTKQPGRTKLEVVFAPHPYLLDGRYAHNAWLQELPDPITQLTWSNAAVLSHDHAQRLKVRDGDIVRIASEDASIELPAILVQGLAPDTIALSLGHGRTAGSPTGVRRGVDVGPLRTPASPWVGEGLVIERTGRHVTLARAQLHDSMHDRDIVRVVRPGEGVAAEREVHLPLYDSPPLKAPQQWGMSIDLGVCTGCSACVVACQAENNVPVVGPEQVALGRRMHWLRVDRYFEPDTIAPIRLMPLACVHCENAPCELVCPTGATQHSADGLNDMNYARCIGTRYCSNNCPYKVRRFNFFRYADDRPPIQRMHNPRVTTRGRGVMEKCTYCTQRIRSVEFQARIHNQLIPDGAVVPACQQACPTNAIVFGDVADESTAVSRSKRSARTYALLGHLNTQPRTTYLADVRAAPEGRP